MRRLSTAAGLAVLVVVAMGLVAGSASAAGNKKLVEGTVYDTTTCISVCAPECPPPPHCGPITARSRADLVCAQRLIVCPLYGVPTRALSPRQVCLPETPCGDDGTDPVYSGEGATINIRRRGSASVLVTLPVLEGHFKTRLGPGEYVLHPHFSEPQCWLGIPAPLMVSARSQGPIAVPISAANSCVIPDAAK
jgi:hypothetical protein